MLAAAPFRLPLDVDPDARFFLRVGDSGELGRLLPLYCVLGAACLALIVRVVREKNVPALPLLAALPAAAFTAFAALSLLWTSDLEAGTTTLAFFLLPFTALVAVVARAPFPPWLPRVLAIIAVALATLFAVIGIWQALTHELLFFAPNLEVANTYAPDLPGHLALPRSQPLRTARRARHRRPRRRRLAPPHPDAARRWR